MFQTSEGPLQEARQHDETTDGTEPEETEVSDMNYGRMPLKEKPWKTTTLKKINQNLILA